MSGSQGRDGQVWKIRIFFLKGTNYKVLDYAVFSVPLLHLVSQVQIFSSLLCFHTPSFCYRQGGSYLVTGEKDTISFIAFKNWMFRWKADGSKILKLAVPSIPESDLTFF